jgi:hypothetical protein
MKRQFLFGGPAELFRVDVAELMAHLGPGWSLDAPLSELGGMLPADYRPSLGTASGVLR